jgi:hypothetical protein
MAQDLATLTGIWVAALYTLFTFSFIYKETPIYRFAEYTFVGATAGHYIVIAYQSIKNYGWYPVVVKGQYIYVLPLILGLMMFSRLSKKQSWISYYPIALLVGAGTALAIRGTIQAEFLTQITSTIAPLLAPTLTAFNNIVIAVTVISTLIYFLFTVEAKGPLKRPMDYLGKIGRYMLMVGFGAQFGAAIMTRLGFVIARFQFLLFDWLHLSG